MYKEVIKHKCFYYNFLSNHQRINMRLMKLIVFAYIMPAATQRQKRVTKRWVSLEIIYNVLCVWKHKRNRVETKVEERKWLHPISCVIFHYKNPLFIGKEMSTNNRYLGEINIIIIQMDKHYLLYYLYNWQLSKVVPWQFL